MALVFQYGSNCLESQINSKDRLCGDAKFIDIAETVDDFRLAFDVWSTKRQCAASDIVESPGYKVWGVLYEVPDFLIERKTAAAQNRKSLDAIEGEGANYKRETSLLTFRLVSNHCVAPGRLRQSSCLEPGLTGGCGVYNSMLVRCDGRRGTRQKSSRLVILGASLQYSSILLW